MVDDDLRTLLKQEIARLTDGRLAAEDIADDEALFTVPGEFDSRIDLDSLDALELVFALEEATGTVHPETFDYRELLNIEAVVSFVRRNKLSQMETYA